MSSLKYYNSTQTEWETSFNKTGLQKVENAVFIKYYYKGKVVALWYKRISSGHVNLLRE